MNMAVAHSSNFNSALVTFGVLTDVQYADCDNRPAGYDPSKTRFYRQSLDHVSHAFEHWNQSSNRAKFVLQLGDIIDGLNHSLGGSYSALQKTLKLFEHYKAIPTFHTVGNHELYNFGRKEVAQLFYESLVQMNIPPEIFSPIKPVSNDNPADSSILYYKFCPTPDVKFISLDCFDVSVLGYEKQHPHYKKAGEILRRYHKHDDFDLWDCDGPLQGLDVRFQQMNGGLGKEQMEWLETELTESDELEQKVIIFGHVSLSPKSTDWSCILWNYEEVVSTFHRHNCVIAYFSGHSHNCGYAVDSHGIHYVVFNGIIEAPPDSMAFATISIFPDRIEILGSGHEKSYNLHIKSTNRGKSKNLKETEPLSSPYSVKVEV